jgi:hypothetical protein
LQSILGPVKLVLVGNTISASLRYTQPGVTSYLVRVPTGFDGEAAFSIEGDPLGQYIVVGGDPSTIVITPQSVQTDWVLEFTVVRRDANDAIIDTFTQTILLDIQELWSI